MYVSWWHHIASQFITTRILTDSDQGWRFFHPRVTLHPVTLPIFTWSDCLCLSVNLCCSLSGLRLSVNSLLASQHLLHNTQSFPDGRHEPHHVSLWGPPNNNFRVHSVDAASQFGVPLFNDAMEINPLDFPGISSRPNPGPGGPGLYRPLEEFDCCIVLFLQTAAAHKAGASDTAPWGWCFLTDLASFLRKKRILWSREWWFGAVSQETNKANCDFSVQTSIRPCQAR